MSEIKGYYKNADKINKLLIEYPTEDIEEGLADISKRVQNVVQFSEMETDEKANKSKPIYYTVNNLNNLHNITIEKYGEFIQKQDLLIKANVIGNISQMNTILTGVEGSGTNDDD